MLAEFALRPYEHPLGRTKRCCDLSDTITPASATSRRCFLTLAFTCGRPLCVASSVTIPRPSGATRVRGQPHEYGIPSQRVKSRQLGSGVGPELRIIAKQGALGATVQKAADSRVARSSRFVSSNPDRQREPDADGESALA